MNDIRRTMTVAAVITMIAAVGSAQEFALEGKISGLTVDPVTQAQIISVMNTDVEVPAGLNIDTPTGAIPFSGPGSLTDRDLPSLVNGATAIITGTRTGGVNVADAVFVEIAENVMFGNADSVDAARAEITINGTGRIRINAPGSGLGDPRFAAVVHPAPGVTVISETGYPMALTGTTPCTQTNPADAASPWVPADSTLPCGPAAGELISAEGDFRTDANGESYLAAHTVEVGKLVLYNPANVVGNKDYVYAGGDAVIEGQRFSLRGFGTFGGGRIFVFRATAGCASVISQVMNNAGTAGINVGLSAADGRYRFDKTAFSGSNNFGWALLRTGTTAGPNPNGATVCVQVTPN